MRETRTSGSEGGGAEANRYPQRHHLKNKLRYMVTHQQGLALWESDDQEWLCGLVEWQGQHKPFASMRRLEELRDEPRAFARAALPTAAESMKAPDLLAAIFGSLGGPCPLDDLVTMVAELWRIKDLGPVPDAYQEKKPGPQERFCDPRAEADAALDQRVHLQHLWAEICRLPLGQRRALLLNLRDAQGRGVLTLIPLTRIATIRQIAEALVMPAEELAAMWGDLPLEDAMIAESLGVTRQQVINLRKSARERLGRRTRAFEPRK